MAIRRGRFGYSFTVIRVLQFFCFVAIAGLCSLPAAEINRLDAPKQAAPIAYALAIVNNPNALIPECVHANTHIVSPISSLRSYRSPMAYLRRSPLLC